ncbi:hypothetical protein LNP02_01405 [Klebsiella variicola subsp. variicola]|nr:hypothetical protein [Klebsiella pneumoniae subsp. pneumoniae]MCS5989477.1 hypothetical protein [Klebsiella variicola subsp. variicola]
MPDVQQCGDCTLK